MSQIAGNTAQKVACPICGQEMPFNPRYPRAVCRACAERTTDAAGRRVGFYDASPTGGILGFYEDTPQPQTERYNRWDCRIDGVACRALEGRFGGVVIERAD